MLTILVPGKACGHAAAPGSAIVAGAILTAVASVDWDWRQRAEKFFADGRRIGSGHAQRRSAVAVTLAGRK